MRVFITGATGFVGTHVARRFAANGYKLTCLVRETSNTINIQKLGVALQVGDITNKLSLLEGMKDCDAVVNLAANVSFRQPDKNIYTEVNVEGTRNVMEAALETGISKIIHVSSAAIYGEPVDCPFTEESPVGPYRRSEYTRTKYAGDQVIWGLYNKHGLPLVVVYPGCVMGPDDPNSTGQQIMDYIRVKLSEGAPQEGFINIVNVTDVAEAIIRALEKDGNIGEKYLLGKYQVSYQDFNKLFRESCGSELLEELLPDCLVLITAAFLAGTRMVFDGSKAERELGLVYTPLNVSISETMMAYRYSKAKLIV